MILDQTDRAPEATVAHDVIGDEPGAHGLDPIRLRNNNVAFEPNDDTQVR